MPELSLGPPVPVACHVTITYNHDAHIIFATAHLLKSLQKMLGTDTAVRGENEAKLSKSLNIQTLVKEKA